MEQSVRNNEGYGRDWYRERLERYYWQLVEEDERRWCPEQSDLFLEELSSLLVNKTRGNAKELCGIFSDSVKDAA